MNRNYLSLQRLLRLTILGVTLAFATYRAVTQSLTCDEAFTYHDFLQKSTLRILGSYDANNHILYSLLGRGTVIIFGNREWAIRLPALAGTCLFVYGVYRFVNWKNTRYWPLAVLLLCFHPYVLDFLSAARGYGLALGFFINATIDLLQSIGLNPDSQPRFRLRTGVLLALSAGANLTFLIPAVSMLMAVFITVLIDGRTSLSGALETMVDQVAGRFGIVSALVLILPLSKATRDQFYYGARNWRQSYESFLYESVAHGGWLDRLPPAAQVIYDLMPLVLISALSIAGAIWLLRFHRDPVLRTAGMALLLSIGLYHAIHALTGTVYPLDRTGFGLLLLALLTIVLAGQDASSSPGLERGLGRCLLGLSLVCGLFFLSQLETTYFSAWKFDAGTKEIARRLQAMRPGDGRTIKIGGSYASGHTLNYYRERLGLNWLAPMQTRAPVVPGMDLYLLSEEDRRYIRDFNLKVIYFDGISGTVLCQRQP